MSTLYHVGGGYLSVSAFLVVYGFSWRHILILLTILTIILTPLLIYELTPLLFHSEQVLAGRITKVGVNYYFLATSNYTFVFHSKEQFTLYDHVVLKGIIVPITTNQNSYEFNLHQWLISSGLKGRINITKILSVEHNSFSYWFANKIHSYSLFSLLWTGQKNSGTSDLSQRFLNLGVIHLLIVSGFHFNLIYQGGKKVFQILHCLPYSEIVFIAIIGTYLYLLNFPVSALRAGVMISLSIITKYFFPRYSQIKRWNSTIIVIMIFRPYQIVSRGFIYSFTLTGLFNYFKYFSYGRGWQKIIGFNFLIWLATSGGNVYFNYQINFTSTIMTFFLTPLVGCSYFTTFIALVGRLEMGESETLQILNNYSSFLTSLTVKGNVGHMPLFLILFYYLLLASLFICSRKFKSFWYSCFYFVVLVIFSFNFVISPTYALTMLNVGNGLSIILQDKGSFKTVLYDVGVGVGRSKHLVADYLIGAGINFVDKIIISHYHQDHYNNLVQVKKVVYVQQVIDYHYPITHFTSGNFQFTIIHRFGSYAQENNNSLVLLVKVVGVNILLTGDIEQMIEEKLSQYLGPKINLGQVPHHGSATSSSIALLAKLSPPISFISAEQRARYCFPNDEVLSRLQRYSQEVHSTHYGVNLRYEKFYQDWQVRYFK